MIILIALQLFNSESMSEMFIVWVKDTRILCYSREIISPQITLESDLNATYNIFMYIHGRYGSE